MKLSPFGSMCVKMLHSQVLLTISLFLDQWFPFSYTFVTIIVGKICILLILLFRIIKLVHESFK